MRTPPPPLSPLRAASTLVFGGFSFLAIAGLVLALSDCVAGPPVKAACAVVDVACGFVAVKMPDGTVVNVPVTDVQLAAKRSVELGTNGK